MRSIAAKFVESLKQLIFFALFDPRLDDFHQMQKLTQFHYQSIIINDFYITVYKGYYKKYAFAIGLSVIGIDNAKLVRVEIFL